MARIFYTDGSTKNNGFTNSKGGYGVIEIKDNTIIWEYQNTKSPATNNEMELMAILTAMRYASNEFEKPIIYTDSAYCYNLINTWMYTWANNNWKRARNEPVKNLEIIKQIYELAHNFTIKKVKGHSDNKWNNYVDKLATGEIKIKQN